jgi:hypothetical protein
VCRQEDRQVPNEPILDYETRPQGWVVFSFKTRDDGTFDVAFAAPHHEMDFLRATNSVHARVIAPPGGGEVTYEIEFRPGEWVRPTDAMIEWFHEVLLTQAGEPISEPLGDVDWSLHEASGEPES